MNTPAWRELDCAGDASADCRLWLIDLRQPVNQGAWLACSPQEHDRASRFRFERDASRYRAAHAGMRQLLSQELGLPANQIALAQGPHGKPHLVDHRQCHFNLSHSGDWALLGMSRTHPIGVDIERHADMSRTLPDMASLTKQVFSDDEQHAFQLLPKADQSTAFYRTWACKEACLKALGSGLTVEPRCVSARWALTWTDAAITLPDSACALRLHGLTLPMRDEPYEGAVALLAAPPHPSPVTRPAQQDAGSASQ